MMTLSSPSAIPVPTTYDRATASQSAIDAASARSERGAADAAGAAKEAKANATANANASSVDTSVPNVMNALSTLAIVSQNMGSVPATLALMSDIAVASGSGTLSDAERSQLQAQYVQLTQQVSSMVAKTGEADSGSSTKDNPTPDSEAGENTQSSDDRRSTLTRLEQQAPQTVYRDPVEQVVTTTKTTVEPDYTAKAPAPSVTLHTHELHVGTDSYEPVAFTQKQTRMSQPATIGQVEQHSTSHRIRVAQVTQITQMSQVAQVAQLSVMA